ncbi:hypothetical protein IEQ34_012330 [Dendrobium chrysotoxum]|uniref:Uncharacterized protein n=1 Tax=Dendrobium chrysotoxum TaxID=161865 RepID=A0AAV7GU80_DENCH|nr:hypothetical protein IEQ34_012330 [Dendrobium chrysotoxum]
MGRSAAGGSADAANAGVSTPPNSGVSGAGFRRGRKQSPDAVHRIAQIRPQNTITIKLTTKKQRAYRLSAPASTPPLGLGVGKSE